MWNTIKTTLKRITLALLWFTLWTLSVAFATCACAWFFGAQEMSQCVICFIRIAKLLYSSVILLCGGLTHVITACTWQILILIFIVLLMRRSKFDDIIESFKNFIDRSKYGNGDVTSAAQPSSVLKQEELDLKQNKTDEANSDDSTKDCASTKASVPFVASIFESNVFKQLQDEEQRFIKRDVRIFNSNLVFDGALEKDNRIIAIEVKSSIRVEMIQRYIAQVDKFYNSLSEKQRVRFSLLVCLPSGAKQFERGLLSFAETVSVPTSYRFFDLKF